MNELASIRVTLQWEKLHTAGCACVRQFWQNLFSLVSAEPASCMLPPAPTNSTPRVTQNGSLDLIILAFSSTYTQYRAHHSSSMKIFLFDDKCSWQQQSQNLKKKKFESTPPATLLAPTITAHCVEVFRRQWSRKPPVNTVCALLSYPPLESFNLKFWILTWIISWAYLTSNATFQLTEQNELSLSWGFYFEFSLGTI